MPVIQIDEKELLTVTDPKDVSVNGQISIGRKFAGKAVRAYVVEVKPTTFNQLASKIVDEIVNTEGSVY